MYSEVTNMAAELQAEEVQSVASVALLDGYTMTTNDGICKAFQSYFQDLLPGIPV